MATRAIPAADGHTYSVLFQPEPEGGFTVTCPTLPGLVCDGETLDEARTTAADAILTRLEALRPDREPTPESDPPEMPLVQHVRVTLEAA